MMRIDPACTNLLGGFCGLTSFVQSTLKNEGLLLADSKVNAKKRPQSVLIVDDEKAVLSSLYRLFKLNGFTVRLAQSAAVGLEILRQYPIDVIISDLRMPEIKGDQFLSETVDISPGSARIILTGLPDQIDRLEGENYQGVIDSCIEKPWSNSDFVVLVNQLIASKSKPEVATPAEAETVHLSEAAKALSHTQNHAVHDSGIDKVRVAYFKGGIDNDDYTIDAISTAKALLAFEELL